MVDSFASYNRVAGLAGNDGVLDIVVVFACSQILNRAVEARVCELRRDALNFAAIAVLSDDCIGVYCRPHHIGITGKCYIHYAVLFS